MRATIRIALTFVVASLLLVVTSPAATAQTEEDQRDTIVVITGRAEVREDERVETVLIADGPAVVDGTVTDEVVAFTGDVLVRGTVEGDVVALDGRVVVTGSGSIEGDVVSRRRPLIEEGGQFDGSWERWNPDAWRRGFAIASRVAAWVAFTVSTLLLGLFLLRLAPRAATAVVRAADGRLGAAAGWGLLWGVGLPIVAVLAVVTLVALPLGVALLLALALIYTVGYVAAAWILGRRIADNARPAGAFLLGWAILRVIALVPVLGGLVTTVAGVLGLGALALAVRRAKTDAGPAAPTPAPAA